MTVVYIHGASATGESFNYIRKHVKLKNDILIEYDSKHGFYNNLEDMKSVLADIDNIQFVCHSLGGIYAVHLADALPDQIKQAVTISTPYGGAESAGYTKYFLPFNQLINDIGPNSDPIRNANRMKIIHPWLNIVSTRGGSPWILQPNDGVVTISSMKHRTDMQFEELHTNHYEVVMSDDTVNIIKKSINNS
jgi:pimeloyl-ACP methyl ester carboxylesterase